MSCGTVDIAKVCGFSWSIHGELIKTNIRLLARDIQIHNLSSVSEMASDGLLRSTPRESLIHSKPDWGLTPQ